MQAGTEWLVDAAGCPPDALRDKRILRLVCELIISDLRLTVVRRGQWHQFAGPAGWTAMFLLTESHLTLHTFPETGTATFNLYCCRPRPDWPWEERLTRLLGAARVSVRCQSRGIHVDELAHAIQGEATP